jgi:hypothetical protein
MLYRGDSKKAFCSISEDLRHDPVAIFAHLRPILEENTDLRGLHFISDSPSNQYRNKKMFYILLCVIRPLFPQLEKMTWNFTESGHGKSACDGIGAVLKRTCDRIVATNSDVSTFEDFVNFVQENVKKIKVIVVSRDEMKEMYESMLSNDSFKNACTVKGKVL